ncbi:MAG: hypothetical protein QW511_02520, partial [Candidatus Methanomethylicia archaeon]
MASDILSFIVVRSYVSILSWFRSLSFLFEFDRRDARIMIDDTIISVGFKRRLFMLRLSHYRGE